MCSVNHYKIIVRICETSNIYIFMISKKMQNMDSKTENKLFYIHVILT